MESINQTMIGTNIKFNENISKSHEKFLQRLKTFKVSLILFVLFKWLFYFSCFFRRYLNGLPSLRISRRLSVHVMAGQTLPRILLNATHAQILFISIQRCFSIKVGEIWFSIIFNTILIILMMKIKLPKTTQFKLVFMNE